jgi:tripartite-type tricarboxylate transporter receptor subunit TctC
VQFYKSLLVSVLAVSCMSASSNAQDYPVRPIRVIVGTSPGGVSDVFIRALGEELHKSLGQPLVVENRAGGSFNIAAKACADSPSDGYTLCVLPGEPLTYNQFLFKSLAYDPEKNFAAITNLFFITQVMAVSA